MLNGNNKRLFRLEPQIHRIESQNIRNIRASGWALLVMTTHSKGHKLIIRITYSTYESLDIGRPFSVPSISRKTVF